MFRRLYYINTAKKIYDLQKIIAATSCYIIVLLLSIKCTFYGFANFVKNVILQIFVE